MRRRKRWLVPTMLVAAASAWMWYRRGDLGRLAGNLHRYSAPSASLYDAVTAPLLGGFFTRVAHDLAELGPRARVLEVGSGPGRLAVKLAEVLPGAEITGVDIAPEMIQRARSLAASSGMTDRLVFRVGDVAALPFPDASFDVVVSTFSAHHWPNPASGLAEIYRVLRPGGAALVYDLADWITRAERRGASIAELANDSPFGDDGTYTNSVTTKFGPLPVVYRAELRRERPSAPGEGAR